ncbi:MAG TPA: DUF4388 domain-containing protein [Thermoleophilia bacterium]|nr:DUF4388 domain-containing protein [Thermoleophilia bacterium]
MLLQGNLQEFSLPNIFQLVKMSAKSGSLSIRRDGEWGRIFFRNGMISYAYSSPQLLPLGERLVKSGAISKTQLKQALAAQKKSPDGPRLGHILLEQGRIDRPTLEQAVREQIQDTAFTFFSWADGEFEFGAEESPPEEDILVEMSVENVIMEGCRRIDEWELIFEQLGSLERVPHLACGDHVDDEGSLTLTAEEWRVIVHIDGRADINTILHECGLDRFHGAKVMYSLFSSGLISVSEPVIESIGKGTSVAVRGPIDIYNEVFISTLTDSNTVKQLRVELIDEKEVEIPVVAGQMPAQGNGHGGGEGEGAGPAEDVLVFTAASTCPEQGWRRLAGESSAWVVLANANDADSLRSTRADLQFIRTLDDVPYVVATYVSMADDELSPKQIARALGLDAGTPVLACQLRDRESVAGVVRAALDLAAARRGA